MPIDEKDKAIIELLTQNAELTTSQISKKTRIPITTVHNRIKRMKKKGIIKNFTVNLDYEKLGKPLTSYILLTVTYTSSKVTQQAIGKKIRTIEGVESVSIVTGTTDMLLKVRIASMKDLSTLITKGLRQIEGVDKTQTLVVMEEV